MLRSRSFPLAFLLSTWVALSALYSALAAPATVAANGTSTSVTEFGEWSYRCEKPANMTEQCALVQSVQAENNGAVGLTIIIVKSPDGQFLLRALAPLGVLLTSELGLMIDEFNAGKVPFIRCLTTGCVAEAILTKELQDKLQKGKTAYFIIAQTPQQSFALPMQLRGVVEGMSTMKGR